MTSKQLASRALSLADLQNSLYITYDDIVYSANEAYKDVYSRITSSGDDYFVNSEIVTITPSMQGDGPFEVLVPLPSDFYKLRTLDYKYNGAWQNMPKFSLSFRNKNPSEPHYRFQGNKLWVIGSNMGSTTFDIRINYYPPAEKVTVPDATLLYGSQISSSKLNSISNPYFANVKAYNGTGIVDNRLYFYYDDTSLFVENYDTKVVTTLKSAIGISNPVYYAGFIYYLLGGQIYYATWAPGMSAPTFVVLPSGPSSVLNFQIQDNRIIYSTAASTNYIPVGGPYSSPSVLYAFKTLGVCEVKGYSAFLDASGALWINNVLIGGFSTKITSDGTSLFVFDSTTKDIQNLSVDVTTPSAPVAGLISLIADVKDMGAAIQGFLPTVGYEVPVFNILSTAADFDFSYPLNTDETIEIMAYQMAIDFKRKQGQDITTLMVRKAELDIRFNETIRKDDYTVEKVRHAYAGQIGVTGNGW